MTLCSVYLEGNRNKTDQTSGWGCFTAFWEGSVCVVIKGLFSELCVSAHTFWGEPGKKHQKQKTAMMSGECTDILYSHHRYYFAWKYDFSIFLHKKKLTLCLYQMLSCRILSVSHICVCEEASATEAKGHKHIHPSTLPFIEHRHGVLNASIARDIQNFFPQKTYFWQSGPTCLRFRFSVWGGEANEDPACGVFAASLQYRLFLGNILSRQTDVCFHGSAEAGRK